MPRLLPASGLSPVISYRGITVESLRDDLGQGQRLLELRVIPGEEAGPPSSPRNPALPLARDPAQ
ncbi:hypothetical protein [Paracoccus aminovorans]|uniref:hypothetical protein n=1 Tax=Paracoccus aminovorans TaxID=34004 RepID=UPI002B2587BD|nr:hypothetical protein [Paracoccus aminovorans]